MVAVGRQKKPKGNIPMHIVVKQSPPDDAWLESESRMMEVLNTLGPGGSNHLVKLYKSCHEEGGSGTAPGPAPQDWDPMGHQTIAHPVTRVVETIGVRRMYMEYCDRGTLKDRIELFQPAFVNNVLVNKPNGLVREEDIWRVFQCLAKACCFLEHGNESDDPTAPSEEMPFVHLDIKSDNGT